MQTILFGKLDQIWLCLCPQNQENKMQHLTAQTEVLIDELYALAHQWTYTARPERMACAEELSDLIEGFKLVVAEMDISWPPAELTGSQPTQAPAE